MGSSGTELLATSGDALRVWEYSGDAPNGGQMSGYVNAKPSNGGHRLTLKSTLSGVSYALCLHYASANEKIVESAATREHWCTNHELLLERKSSLDDCDVLYRHDLYSMEYRDCDSRNPTDCSWPRSVRCCLASGIYGHLRFRGRWRLFTRFRPSLTRAFDHPVRNANAETHERRRAGCSRSRTTRNCSFTADRIQSSGCKLYEYLPYRQQWHTNIGYAESRTAGLGIEGA